MQQTIATFTCGDDLELDLPVAAAGVGLRHHKLLFEILIVLLVLLLFRLRLLRHSGASV